METNCFPFPIGTYPPFDPPLGCDVRDFLFILVFEVSRGTFDDVIITLMTYDDGTSEPLESVADKLKCRGRRYEKKAYHLVFLVSFWVIFWLISTN